MSQQNVFLYIGGAGHSGTSLLVKSMSQHSKAISTYGETRLIESWPAVTKEYKNIKESSKRLEYLEEKSFFGIKFIKDKFGREKNGINPFKNIINAEETCKDFKIDYNKLIHKSLNHYDKSLFLEKTPSNIYHADDIMALAPNAKLLLINRDVRDVVASLKKRYLVLQNNPEVYKRNLNIKKLDKDYNLVTDSIMWSKTVQASFKALERYGPDRVKIIQYEDFVDTPQEHFKMICDWLDIKFEEEMLNSTYRNSADPALKSKKGISKSSVGNYRKLLNEDELKVIKKYGAKGLNLLGLEVHAKGGWSSYKYEMISYLKILNRVRKRIMLMKPSYVRQFAKRFLRRLSQ